MSRVRLPLFLALAMSSAAFGATAPTKDSLQIDKAFIGSKDAWRDVTQFFQDQIESGTLKVRITQPFSQIGGDPSPGQVKSLLIDYRLNGQPYRLSLNEEFPVAFSVVLPASDARAPGTEPQATALMQDIATWSSQRSQLLRQPGLLVGYASLLISFAALILSILALTKARRAHVATPPPKTP